MMNICNKLCIDAPACKHSLPHKTTTACKVGCENGAVCQSVDKSAKSVIDNGLTNTAKLNNERGEKYGPAIEEFSTEQLMYAAWISRRIAAACSFPGHHLEEKAERALRQAVLMCIVKLVRAAQSPQEADHWDDLMGYARCAKMILGLEK